MWMTLELLDTQDNKTTLSVKEAWISQGHGYDKLYYETVCDEHGKGTFIKLNTLKCWRLRPGKDHTTEKLKL